MPSWACIASPLTSRPSSASVSRSALAARVSFSPSATARCAMATRAPVPKAVTTWSAERPAARSKERRSVLPSMASTPSPALPRSSRKASKVRAKAAGSSRRKTRLKVSWLGKPFFRLKNSRSSVSRSSANSAKSTQLSAPQTDATSAIANMSSNSCRCAFPRRGSGISPSVSIRAMCPPSRTHGRIQITQTGRAPARCQCALRRSQGDRLNRRGIPARDLL